MIVPKISDYKPSAYTTSQGVWVKAFKQRSQRGRELMSAGAHKKNRKCFKMSRLHCMEYNCSILLAINYKQSFLFLHYVDVCGSHEQSSIQ